MTDGGEVRLGRDGVRIGWVYVASMVAALAASGVFALVEGAAITWVGAIPVSIGVLTALVVNLTRLGHDELVLGPHEVVARTRGEEHRWPWSEVLELGMVRANTASTYFSPGCTVMVRVEGRAFDVPGPNMPLAVTIPAFGRTAHRRVRSTLERVAAERSIPFDHRGLRMATMPRPDSPLRPGRAPRVPEQEGR